MQTGRGSSCGRAAMARHPTWRRDVAGTRRRDGCATTSARRAEATRPTLLGGQNEPIWGRSPSASKCVALDTCRRSEGGVHGPRSIRLRPTSTRRAVQCQNGSRVEGRGKKVRFERFGVRVLDCRVFPRFSLLFPDIPCYSPIMKKIKRRMHTKASGHRDLGPGGTGTLSPDSSGLRYMFRTLAIGAFWRFSEAFGGFWRLLEWGCSRSIFFRRGLRRDESARQGRNGGGRRPSATCRIMKITKRSQLSFFNLPMNTGLLAFFAKSRKKTKPISFRVEGRGASGGLRNAAKRQIRGRGRERGRGRFPWPGFGCYGDLVVVGGELVAGGRAALLVALRSLRLRVRRFFRASYMELVTASRLAWASARRPMLILMRAKWM
jgi:hypothetical protein